MEADMYSELLVELECPVCTNYMTPPIRQCVTGHSICEQCRRRLPKCPLCQEVFTESKNISLEALARKMHYPCINKNSGCNVRLSYDEREQHESVCQFKGFRCGIEKCSWIGRYEEVEQHWDSKKMSSKPYLINNVCHTKLKPDFFYVNLVKAHNKLFWFKCKATMGNVFWAVQYIGNGNDAENYYYQIELFKPGFTRCKALLSNYCQKVATENAELFQEGKCISVTLEALNQYISEDQVLIYYMRVYEDKKKPTEENADCGLAATMSVLNPFEQFPSPLQQIPVATMTIHRPSGIHLQGLPGHKHHRIKHQGFKPHHKTHEKFKNKK